MSEARRPANRVFGDRRRDEVAVAWARVPTDEALQRSAPVRYRRLCAGITRLEAAGYNTRAAAPQPHRWWPFSRRGAVCLRCSAITYSATPPR